MSLAAPSLVQARTEGPAATPSGSSTPAAARPNPHGVLELFTNRWSPRAFQTRDVPRDVVAKMVEAARWAPSSINLQPWRFFITLGTQGETRASWNAAVGERNRLWSDNAPVLTWVVARKVMGANPFAPPETTNRHAFFDTGAAAIQFVLEGERHGVRSHYLGGIDAAKAHALLGLDADHEVVCAIVSGYAADPSTLSEGFRAREHPSGRLGANDIAEFR